MKILGQRYLPLIVMFSALFGLGIGLFLIKQPLVGSCNLSANESEKALVQALDLISENALNVHSRDSLVQLGIQAMVGTIDPYSRYISPSEKTLEKNFAASFVSLGLKLVEKADKFYVLSDRDSARLIKPGAEIVSIDNSKPSIYNGSHLNENREVDLKYALGNDTISINCKPESYGLNNIGPVLHLNQSTNYVRINRFRKDTYGDFMRYFEPQILQNEKKNFILDLRSNPGGYLEEVIKLINQFISEKDQVFLKLDGKKREYSSTGKVLLPWNKLVILIDEKSASSAEVMAGALKGRRNVLIIGSPSKGKRMIQRPFELSDGAKLYISTAYYRFENETDVERDSLGPVVPDKLNPNDNNQLYLSDFLNLSQSCHVAPNFSICMTDSISERTSEFHVHNMDYLMPYLSEPQLNTIILSSDSDVALALDWLKT